MLFDPIKQKEVSAIPKPLKSEWEYYTSNISSNEKDQIISWINDQFDDVSERNEKVQPSGWLGSGFNWKGTALFPIYRESKKLLSSETEQKIQEKAGQIFGLFISLALADYRDEKWYFVKGDTYKARGVPIKSRIYFLPDK